MLFFPFVDIKPSNPHSFESWHDFNNANILIISTNMEKYAKIMQTHDDSQQQQQSPSSALGGYKSRQGQPLKTNFCFPHTCQFSFQTTPSRPFGRPQHRPRQARSQTNSSSSVREWRSVCLASILNPSNGSLMSGQPCERTFDLFGANSASGE